MSINAINSNNLLSSIYAAAYAPASTQSNITGMQPLNSSEEIDISIPGKLMNAISQMTDQEKTEMETFRQELTEAVQNGTFDAETMAASAPDALAEFAEENGVELTQMLQDMADGMENNRGVYGPPPPPPPMMSDTSGLDLSSLEDLSDDEKSEIKSFMEELSAAVQGGTFDEETMAASAPDSLATLAEENGMELADLIGKLAEDAERTGKEPPPPPMDGAIGNYSLFNQFYSDNAGADEKTSTRIG
jgi:hypothetical protein